MSSPQPCVLPEQAFLGRYATGGAYTDCFTVQIPGSVSQADYIEAFYTGALFKLERLLLSSFVNKPSTDTQAKRLATGELSAFAAWEVEERSADQLLMRDTTGRTRSWLMTVPSGAGSAAGTRLYFGSAVVPVTNKKSGKAELGFVFSALLGFHKMYSKALLSAAGSRLERLGEA